MDKETALEAAFNAVFFFILKKQAPLEN